MLARFNPLDGVQSQPRSKRQLLLAKTSRPAQAAKIPAYATQYISRDFFRHASQAAGSLGVPRRTAGSFVIPVAFNFTQAAKDQNVENL